MIYIYVCPKCDDIHEVSKPVVQVDKKEYCPDCQSRMQRIYGASIKTGDGTKMQGSNNG